MRVYCCVVKGDAAAEEGLNCRRLLTMPKVYKATANKNQAITRLSLTQLPAVVRHTSVSKICIVLFLRCPQMGLSIFGEGALLFL